MAISRRDFVALLLGTPAAMAACRSAGRLRTPDGELLTPGKAAGHRLRDAAPVTPGMFPAGEGAEPHDNVIVVGGGIAGLSAAWWLDRAGVKNVLVLELDRVAGGTAQAGASAVTPYPWGAHYVVSPMRHQTAMRALLEEMGALAGIDKDGEPVVVEDLRVREPEERVFYRGRWYEGQYLHAGANAADRDQLARFRAEIDRWVAWRDDRGRRAFALPASAGSTDVEVISLDRISFAQWLGEHGFDSGRLRWLCDYACRDDFGLLAADTSAWAGIAYFASRVARPGAEHQSVVTWPEGNGALVAHLTAKLGARVRVDHAVVDVAESPDGAAVDVGVLAHGVRMGYRARHVIVATPGFVARRIVGRLRGPAARAVPKIDRGAWAVANLHLDSRLRTRHGDAPLAWDNVLYDSPSLGYVVATHQRGREQGPTVLTWYYPFTGDGASARKELDTATREDWAEVALADLAQAHPDLRSRCTRIDVAYWGHGMPRPRVGTVFDHALGFAREPLGRIHFASSELSGVSLFEEALDQGVRAAEEILAVRAARGAWQ